MIPPKNFLGPVMLSKLRLSLLIPFAALLGCGSTPTPSAPATTYLDLTGNWMALGHSSIPPTFPGPIADFTGALQSNHATVSGTLRAADLTNPANPCVLLTQDLAATGTIDAANNLTLTVPISNGMATITATLSQNLHSFMSGSYMIAGGACAMPATPMTISQFAPATGTFTGTFNLYALGSTTPTPGTATAITAVLTQSTTPNADGQFPLSGTITATGACTDSVTFTNGLVIGDGILSQSLLSQGNFIGAIDPTANSLSGLFEGFAACNYQGYTGTLTRQ